MSRKSRLTAFVAPTIAVVVVAPVAAAAPISKAIKFTNQTGKVTCGVEIHAPSKPASKVLCAAKGIPAPTKKSVGDSGFVQIGVLGAPQLLRLTQDSFVSGRGKSVKLARGRLWNQLGVTCHMGEKTVLCFNGNDHGFVIGTGHYKSF